jgi:2-polyprenyl-3-methyl-5-hydroxy-6-metoxy-1,4-benzoquinol methylase
MRKLLSMKNVDIERVANLYDSGAYSANTSNWEDSTGLQRSNALIRLLRGNMSRVSSVLDIGCGSGGVLRNLRQSAGAYPDIFEKSLSLVGCDASHRAIEMAKSLTSTGLCIDFRQCLIEEFSHNSEKYDLVLLIHVLEHVPDMLQMIHSAFGLANTVYINIPIEITPLYLFRAGAYARQFKNYGHIHFFTESFFKEYLRSNGFVILGSGYSYDYLGQTPTFARSLLRPIRKAASLALGSSFANALFGGISATYLLARA